MRTAENVQTEAVDGVWPMLEAVDGRGNGADVHNGFARPTPSPCTSRAFIFTQGALHRLTGYKEPREHRPPHNMSVAYCLNGEEAESWAGTC